MKAVGVVMHVGVVYTIETAATVHASLLLLLILVLLLLILLLMLVSAAMK